MRMTREFYIPRESSYRQNVERQVYEAEGVEVYRYDNSQGKPAAAMFGGKRAKPDKEFYYQSEEAREAAIESYLEGQRFRKESMDKARAERNAAGRGLEVGDYLSCSWGYDQTNVNYYKVVSLVGKKMVEIVPVVSVRESSAPPCDMVSPSDELAEYDVLLGMDRGKVRPVKKVAKNGSVSLNDHQSASKCSGEPQYETSFGYGH